MTNLKLIKVLNTLKKVKKKILLFFTAIFLALLIFLVMPGPLKEDTKINIPKGATVSTVMSLLKEQDAYRSEFLMYATLRIHAMFDHVVPGEFVLNKGISIAKIPFFISSHKNILQYNITIIEGSNHRQVKRALESNPHLTGDITVDIEEGYLMPETYYFEAGYSRDQLISRMVENQKSYVTELWETHKDTVPLKNIHEVLTLASLIEQETPIKDEMPTVASVFYNRLEKGMRLQTDPTVAYGLGRDNADRLTVSDLRSKHPYNTYIINGLPPTPISMPSKESINAVFNPAETDYIFFVADGTGGHFFSVTLREHNKAVRKWREIEREIRANEAKLNQ